MRLSGQDCGRGTFSQRHAVLYDQETEERHIPLTKLRFRSGAFEVVDSFLSEEGVLGFEYGYSLADPNSLVLWEAQFGDFCNGAQVYFDQFISAGEAKWLRMSGLVCLVPHGFEGPGPRAQLGAAGALPAALRRRQSSGPLSVDASDPTFHGLRRQLTRDFRKPLIVMTPKSLLRHKRCVVAFAEMATKAAASIGSCTSGLHRRTTRRSSGSCSVPARFSTIWRTHAPKRDWTTRSLCCASSS